MLFHVVFTYVCVYLASLDLARKDLVLYVKSTRYIFSNILCQDFKISSPYIRSDKLYNTRGGVREL